MSDNTANAREPSMEDILASIRRIIDEEDTRDARPASDHLAPVESRSHGGHEGAVPVMAAATVDRDDDDDEGGLFDEIDDSMSDVSLSDGPVSGDPERREAPDAFDAPDDDTPNDNTLDDDGEGDSVFPERESPFWSRATGRDAAGSARDDGESEVDGGDADYAGAFDADSDRDVSGDDSALDDLSGTRTDIFTRAQNKLEGGPRPSTRERMQSLAARAEERAGATAKAGMGVVAPVFGRGSQDDDDKGDDSDRTTLTSLDAPTDPAEYGTARLPTPDNIDVLDLTDPMERAEASGDSPVASSGDTAFASDDRDDRDADGQGDTSSYASATGITESWKGDTDKSRDRNHDMDDVLDLTTPLGGLAAAVDTGSVESGEAFHVSGVEEDDPQDGGIEDAISRHLVQDETNPEREESAGHDAPVEAPDPEDFRETVKLHDTTEDRDATEARDAVEARDVEASSDTGHTRDTDHETQAPRDTGQGIFANTYSRFDDTEETDERAYTPAQEPESEVEDTYSTAFVTLDDAPSTPYAPEAPDAEEEVATADTDEPAEASAPEEDEPDSGENIGFPDTFSASDVYHDEPPALDEDYSHSLGDGDELAAEQAAFAAQMQEEDGMEAVGGMVRDAMERDPVDYSDPAALVSMTSEEISARALASLADVEGEASRRVYGSLKISESDSGEGDSLEGMVRGMLKPMLREWLDDNLPTMVESAVRGEVERISSKSRKYSRASDND